MTTTNNYPVWTASYSNEEFDRTSRLASELTEADRQAGRPAPKHGYSDENWTVAEKIVRDANAYSEHQCKLRDAAKKKS